MNPQKGTTLGPMGSETPSQTQSPERRRYATASFRCPEGSFLGVDFAFGEFFPKGSIYTTIMEIGHQNHSTDGLLGPNSIMVVYMDPLGSLCGSTIKPPYSLRIRDTHIECLSRAKP